MLEEIRKQSLMDEITRKQALDIVKNSRHCFKIDGNYPEDETIAIFLSDGTFIFISEFDEWQEFDARKIVQLEYYGSDCQCLYSK